MRKILIPFFVFIFIFSFITDSHADTGKWGGTVATGGDCNGNQGTFNICFDPKADCVSKDSSSDPICTTSSHPKVQCAGYDPNDSTHAQETGICYFSKDNNLPSCSDLTAADYHQDPHYHHISDVITSCGYNAGHTYQCCAPDVQPSPNYPPPPCTSSGKDKSICTSVNTGFGTIQVDPGSVVGALFGALLGLAGGIALVLIIFSGYQIIFAQADPEKLTAARERLTSAIIGLLFIIFSITILQIIGVDILHLPGLNR